MDGEPITPSLITSRQLKQVCVFCFSPLDRQPLDNFNYCFNSVKCTAVAGLGTKRESFPCCFSHSSIVGFLLGV